jgi:hypothetical protein
MTFDLMRETILAHLKEVSRSRGDPQLKQIADALEECLRLAGQAEQLKEVVVDLRAQLTALAGRPTS